MRDILDNDPQSNTQELADVQLALADWYQWHHFYAEALQKYREAWGMMAGGTHAYKYLHDMRFRPRFVNGKAVTTQALERNYTIHY